MFRLGIETFVVGIGNGVDRHELTMIASDKEHTFTVRHFDSLESIHQDIVDAICASKCRLRLPSVRLIEEK